MKPFARKKSDMESTPTQYPASSIPDEIKLILVQLVDSGMALEDNRDYSRAIGVYRSYLKLDRSNPWIFAHLAECLYMTGSADDAVDSFSKALELDHQYLWAYAGRGRIYFDRMEFALALLDFQQALALNQDDTWILNHAGECLLALNRFDQAILYFNQSIGLKPDDEWTLAHRGMALMQSGRLEDSRLDLNAAIRIDPKYAWAHHYLGILNGREELYDEARKEFDLVLKLSPGFTMVYRERGLMFSRMGEYDLAIQEFEHLSAIFPRNGSLYRLIAETQDTAGRLDSARANYIKAYRLGDHSSSLQCAIGAICIDLKLYDEAMRALNLAIKWNSSELTAFVNRAEILFSRGKYALALKDIDRAIELGPEQPARVWTLRAKINTAKGAHENALADYSTALQNDPNYVKALIGRGSLFHFNRRDIEAVDDFSAANMIQPDNVDILMERAQAFRQMHNHQAAILDLESVALIDPETPDALQQLMELYLLTDQKHAGLALMKALTARKPDNHHLILVIAHALSQNGLYPEALTACERYIAIHPKQADGYIELAWVYKAMFEFDHSSENLEIALKFDPDDPMIYGYRAMIHRNLDRYDLAIADYNKALELNPNLGWVYANRGLSYYEKGQLSEAERDYRKAVALNYKNSWIWFRLANLHIDQWEGEKALSAIDQARLYQVDSVEGYYLGALANYELKQPEAVDQWLQNAIRVGEASRSLPSFDLYQSACLAKSYLAAGYNSEAIDEVNRILKRISIPEILTGIRVGFDDLHRLLPEQQGIQEALKRFDQRREELLHS
jgi:tetratricopeptide (TPR) repeat protein